MKSLTRMLNNSTALTPKQRALLVVRDDYEETTNGAQTLTENDRHALTRTWKPHDQWQAEEYNKYIEAWDMYSGIGIDAQTYYYSACVSALNLKHITQYFLLRNDHMHEFLTSNTFGVSDDEARRYLLEQTGIELPMLIHTHALSLLNTEVRDDLERLCPDITTDYHYLQEERELATLLGDAEQFSEAAKETIMNEICSQLSHPKYSLTNNLGDAWLFHRYHASFPLKEIARVWCEKHGIQAKNVAEGFVAAVDERKLSLEKEIRTATRELLDDGLFITQYTVLARSTGTATCNESETRIVHNELYRLWSAVYAEADSVIQKLLENGDLTTRTTENETYVIGTSLARGVLSSGVVTKYLESIEAYIPFGRLMVYMHAHKCMTTYVPLTNMRDTCIALGRIFDLPLQEKLELYISEVEQHVRMIDESLCYIYEYFVFSKEKPYVHMFTPYLDRSRADACNQRIDLKYRKKCESLLRHDFTNNLPTEGVASP